MLISFQWLKEYVNLPDSVTPEEVSDKLKLSTVEVEGILDPGKNLDNVVVGKIITVEKHPNADKLKVCSVDVGGERVTIVCGGSNVSEGMFVIVAKNGAKVKWHGEGDLIELKPATIRGVESNGMICGADEVGLLERFPKKEEKEIVDLKDVKNISPGQPLAVALNLNDAILEIDNKSLSNRPDLWGHYGIAREVAVLFNREVKPYETVPVKEGKEIKIAVDVADPQFCSKIMFAAVSGVTVGPSPAWLQQKLQSVGQRPINNIVDITNYVMFDLGKPMHAFDARALDNNGKGLKIVVRPAKDGEELELLDGKKIKLSPEYSVVGNADRALSLAGIMGGVDSGVKNDTTTIVFETAIFNPTTIRQSSTRLGVRTDSSARFEKSLDPAWCEVSLQKAVALVLEICPGATVASKVVNVGNPRLAVGPLEVPLDFFAKKLGVDVPIKTVVQILERLGFGVVEKKKALSIKIPTWRATKDISIAEDIVEEVARIYGYDQIPATLPVASIAPPAENTLRTLEHTITETLVRELGYTEVYNYSFVSAGDVTKMGDNLDLYLELDNPLSKEQPFLRRHLITNLLNNVSANIENRNELRLFEIGKVYIGEEAGVRVSINGDELLPRQDTKLTAVFVQKRNQTPFWQARAAAETLSRTLGVAWEYAPASAGPMHPWFHPSRTTWLKVGDTNVGCVAEIHPRVSEAFGIADRVAVCSLKVSTLDALPATTFARVNYRALSPYPAVVRDIAVVVKKEITHAAVAAAASVADPLIVSVVLFDVYEGKTVGEGYKSMAYHITYASNDRTLTAAEVDAAEAKVLKALKEKCGADVRT